MGTQKDDDKFPEPEARRRFEAALRVGLSTPPKLHSEMKLGKPRGKRAKSLSKRKAAKKAR